MTPRPTASRRKGKRPSAGLDQRPSEGSNRAGRPPPCQKMTCAAVECTRAHQLDEAGQALRRVDRVDEDPFRRGEQLRGRLGRPGSSAHNRGRSGRRRARSQRSAGRSAIAASATTSRSTFARSSLSGWTANPMTRVAWLRFGARTPASAAPTTSPACVPPVAVGRTMASGWKPASDACPTASSAASTWPQAPMGSEPPTGRTRRAGRRDSASSRHARDERLALGSVVRPRLVDLGAELSHQPDVRRRCDGRPAHDDVDLEPEPRAGGGRQPAVVRPAPARRHDGVGARPRAPLRAGTRGSAACCPRTPAARGPRA